MAELYYGLVINSAERCNGCGAIILASEEWKHNIFHDKIYALDTEICRLGDLARKLETDFGARILELEQELEKKQNPMFVINRENDGSLRIRPAEDIDAEDPF